MSIKNGLARHRVLDSCPLQLLDLSLTFNREITGEPLFRFIQPPAEKGQQLFWLGISFEKDHPFRILAPAFSSFSFIRKRASSRAIWKLPGPEDWTAAFSPARPK